VISTVTVSSEGSGLFVTDDDESNPLALWPVIDVYQVVGADVEPADVAEEIVDAVARFSRRCNRHCEPLRLEISKEVWEDEDVSDAVRFAAKQELGRFEEGKGGKWLCTVGPV
jgi:hypothetical protein